MMKKIFVKNLKDYLEREICEVFYLKDVSYSLSDGNKWQDLLLTDVSGRAIGKCWSEYIQDIYADYQGKVVRVTGKVELFRDMYCLKVVDVQLAAENEFDMSDLRLELSHEEEIGLINRLNELILSVKNEQYRSLLCSIFTPNKIKKFVSIPASKKFHHTYYGGWLKHTIEVVELSLAAVKLCAQGPVDIVGVDVDLIITGALLHDVGNISSFKPAIEPSLTLRGSLVGCVHDTAIFISCVNNAIQDEKQKVPDLTELLHIVISAHGNEIKPMTKEAVIVYQADCFSTSFNAVDTLFYDFDKRHSDEVGKGKVYSSFFETDMMRFNGR